MTHLILGSGNAAGTTWQLCACLATTGLTDDSVRQSLSVANLPLKHAKSALLHRESMPLRLRNNNTFHRFCSSI
jgi:hypothetical protein